MDEIKAASLKGLTATIKDMQEEGEDISSNQFEKPVNPISKPAKQVYQDLQGEFESVEVKGDALSHLENLEAEIWAALDDAEKVGVDDVDNSVHASVGVDVGGVTPSHRVNTRADERLEVTKSTSHLSGNKKIKVTSVQVNIRRSSRSEDVKNFPSQPQPVKQVLQDPKPGKASKSSRADVAQERKSDLVRASNQERDPEPVKLRRHREPVATKPVVKDTPAVKKEKTVAKSNMEARRSYM